MADTKISGLPAVPTPALTDEFPVNQGAASKKMTLAQIRNFFATHISGNSGAANANAAPSETTQVLTADATANSTTTNAIVMTTTALPAGTYRYRYDILATTTNTATSVKFAVDATGTVTKHLYRLLFPDATATAATGAVAQAAAAATGFVYGQLSTRTDNTTLGPLVSHDATTEVHYVIEGVLVTSTSGNLTLAHGSETAVATQVRLGTMLRLERLN